MDITKVDKIDTKREREVLLNKFTELNEIQNKKERKSEEPEEIKNDMI